MGTSLYCRAALSRTQRKKSSLVPPPDAFRGVLSVPPTGGEMGVHIFNGVRESRVCETVLVLLCFSRRRTDTGRASGPPLAVTTITSSLRKWGLGGAGPALATPALTGGPVLGRALRRGLTPGGDGVALRTFPCRSLVWGRSARTSGYRYVATFRAETSRSYAARSPSWTRSLPGGGTTEHRVPRVAWNHQFFGQLT